MDKIKWAIVGTGYIANEFAKGLMEAEDCLFAANVSRNADKGKAFSDKYGGTSECFTDYDEMLAKADVDVVYIAIPNNCHYEYIMKALDAGKNVLSEKPMADNADQLREILAKAKEKDLFIMEGMWTRCFPATIKIKEWIDEGRIGEPLSVNVAFDIKTVAEDWQPWKGTAASSAGALRDVGIYSIAWAYLVFPDGPENIHSVYHINEQGVDDCFRMLFDYGEGKSGYIGGAFNQQGGNGVEIVGTEGRITAGPELWHPTTAVLTLNDGTVEKQEIQFKATGFEYEACEVKDCLREGRKESRFFPLSETVKIADLIEKQRKEWGIVYPSDK